MEHGLRLGRLHGPWQSWDNAGRLDWTTQYVDCLEHGTAYQWGEDGQVIGSYTMDHGTGLDLWWTYDYDGDTHVLSEVRWYKDGYMHGYEWWLNYDQRSVRQESHLWEGHEHGIQRTWNAAGRLRRGFPKYYVHGQKVTKRQYLRAAAQDPTLPPFRPEDNRPERHFPPEVQAAIKRRPTAAHA